MKKKKSRSGKAAEAAQTPLPPRPFRLPPILLEGDESGAPEPAVSHGQKDALGPAAPAEPLEVEAPGLPENYGTRTLLLAARDPHWLYAHWDVAPEEQSRCAAVALGGHLVLRVYERAASGAPAAEMPLHPESRHWSVCVPRAETQYVAELGCLLPGGPWKTLDTSDVVTTPPDSVSQDRSVQFATIQPPAEAHATGGDSPSGSGSVAATTDPLAAAPTHSTTPAPGGRGATAPIQPPAKAPLPDLVAGLPDLQARLRPVPPPAAALQEAAVEHAMTHAQPSQVGANSAEIAALLQPLAHIQVGPQPAVESGQSSLAGLGEAISSPAGGQPAMAAAPVGGGALPGDFWLNVYAELVIHGATEPDALVAITGEPILLRPDGSFSYRLALPDGHYDVAVTAVSAHDDQRQVTLHFTRRTDSPPFTTP